ncbi:MAG: hypothetical protein ACPLKQ_06675 [Candidatus Bathyarchaeales archaeon]
MKRKIFALVLLVFSALLLASSVNAQTPKSITAWTDKSLYNPGDSGKLYIALYNTRESAITITKVVVTFEAWRAFNEGVWEGNKTIEVNKALVSGETCLVETDFTVPTDGRAVTTSLDIEVYTKEAGIMTLPHGDAFYIRVSEAPSNYLSQIVSLLTIQVALMIVCTVIIAAALFLATRKPKAMWREEEEKPSSQSAPM